MSIGVTHFVVVGALLLAAGAYAVLSRSDLTGMLGGVAVMTAGAAAALAGFARFGEDASHPVAASSTALLAALVVMAQVTAGSAMVVLLRRRRGVEAEPFDERED